MVGRKFGRLTALEFSHKLKNRAAVWWCVCECGTRKTVRGNDLTSGKTISCGCYKDANTSARMTKHKAKGSRAYNSWRAMRRRCMQPGDTQFHNYGGRGISICEKWSDFNAFLADMGPPPPGRYSIDRIDVNGNYEPSNCRWADDFTQARNRRKSVRR